MEQRSRDIAGLIGQVRGFNLDAFLSDYEQPGEGVPWAVGNDAWVKEGPAGGGRVLKRPITAGLETWSWGESRKLLKCDGIEVEPYRCAAHAAQPVAAKL